jgi:hypothetical protein
VPAGEIERFVVEQIKGIGREPVVVAETVRQVRQQTEAGIERLEQERSALQRQLRDDHAKLQAAAAMTDHVERVSRLANVQECVRVAERRLTETWDEFLKLHAETLWQADFMSVRSLSKRGFQQLFVIVFIHVGSRRLFVTPSTANPDAAWVRQQGEAFLAQLPAEQRKKFWLFREFSGWT